MNLSHTDKDLGCECCGHLWPQKVQVYHCCNVQLCVACLRRLHADIRPTEEYVNFDRWYMQFVAMDGTGRMDLAVSIADGMREACCVIHKQVEDWLVARKRWVDEQQDEVTP